MARLITEGFEFASITSQMQLPAQSFNSSDAVFGIVSPASFNAQTSVVRSGSYSAQVSAGNPKNVAYYHIDSQKTTDPSAIGFYFRVAVRFSAWPGAARGIMGIFAYGNNGHPHYSPLNVPYAFLSVSTTGQLSLRADNSGVWTNLGSAYGLTLDTWHVLEIGSTALSQVASTTWRMRVDDTERASGAATPPGNNTWVLGAWVGFDEALSDHDGANNDAFYCDDVALNDSAGSDQNTWPGDGKIILLRPISDNARVGWTGGGGGTTNLFDAVDNRPPVGVAVGAATNTSQIIDSNNNNTDNYDANCQTFTTGGVTGSDTVVICQAVAAAGVNTSSPRNFGVKAVSNPADAGEFNTASSGGTAGTHPTGWSWMAGRPVYNPSVTLGTSPVVRIGKRTATTDTVMCDALGLTVEYRATGATVANKDLQAVWGVAGTVNKDLQSVWTVKTVANKDLQAVWEVLVAVNKDLQAVWEVGAAVGVSLAAQWDVVSAGVGTDLEAQWGVLAAVGKEVSTLWNTFEVVGQDLQTVWAVYAFVGSDLQGVWEVLGPVAKNLQAVWGVGGIVGGDLVSFWNVPLAQLGEIKLGFIPLGQGGGLMTP